MQTTQRKHSAMPCRNKVTPVMGTNIFSGNTGTPAGLKMLSSRKRNDRLAKFQPEYIKAATAGKKVTAQVISPHRDF